MTAADRLADPNRTCPPSAASPSSPLQDEHTAPSDHGPHAVKVVRTQRCPGIDVQGRRHRSRTRTPPCRRQCCAHCRRRTCCVVGQNVSVPQRAGAHRRTGPLAFPRLWGLLELFALQHDQGPCVECCRTGTARTNINLNSPKATASWPRFATRARETGYVITHAIPLRLRDRNIGALNLSQKTPHRLGESDIALAQALAGVATITILQQRTLERSHVEKTQLQTALNSRILVEQVKGILSERWRVSTDEAFFAFRGYARTNHLRLADFARSIIAGEFDTSVMPLPLPEV
ncbi:ANTAR domain-containing protein [Streptomyces sp. NPDC094438]|uniref:ANTAR domain-containing protein n=1 Tax=Streptomyces sp. NPDC094438 TaxID=3366061 RepID=UPI0037FEAA64